MTEKDANDILEMIQEHWQRYYGKATKDMFVDFLLEQDAEIVTKAVAKLAATQIDVPRIADIRDMMGTIEGGRPALEPGVCQTCGGDRMVLVGTRPAVQTPWMKEKGIEVPEDRGGMEEYVPCPTCNAAADASFHRADGTFARSPDPDRIRERMQQ